MVIVRFLGWMISLPLFWLGQILRRFKSPVCLPLFRAAWHLSCDDQIGVAALRTIRELESPESARVHAANWLQSHPQPGVACFAGMLALEAGDLDAAARLRDLCVEQGGDYDGFVDWLDLQLVLQLNDPQAIEEKDRQLETRRDLSALVSKTLHEQLLIRAMSDRNWDEIKRRADFLDSIEGGPLTATAHWVLSRHDGQAKTLERFLEKTRATPGQALFFQGFGHIMLGEFELARQSLDKLRGSDARLADSLTTLLTQAGAG